MNSQAPQPQASTKSQEIRLGLVMYGGISLAIYINGVSRELYRAVRGESVYKLIKGFTDSDIVVDIVSGTSAGGVNGILLGYALCNNADFSTTASLWREAGDLGTLIRDPVKRASKNVSVLDGEGHYQRQMENAFAMMEREGAKLRAHDGTWLREGIDPSKVQEMDVFITGTDVDGRVSTWLDAQGHPVDIKDHRTVFQLKYRASRKNDFRPDPNGAFGGVSVEDEHKALAKLARITSCFPVALPPVRLLTKDDSPKDRDYWSQSGKADQLLARWGKVRKRESYFLDGGILDNKPFTYTIREIYYRLSDRAVQRKLFYVEPDPETFAANSHATEVNVLQAAQRARITIPGYESISEDLKLLAAHNEKIRRYRRLSGGDLKDRTNALAEAARIAEESLDSNTRVFIARMRALERGEALAATDQGTSRYAMARLVTLSERAVRGVIRDEERDSALDQPKRTTAQALYQMFDEWEDPQDRLGDLTLYRFDVYFRLRRLFHVLSACGSPGPVQTEANKLLRELRHQLGRQIRLLEIIRGAMEKLVDEGQFHWERRAPKEVWATVDAAYRMLLHVDEQEDPLPAGYPRAWERGPEDLSWLDQATLNQVHARLFGGRAADLGSHKGRLAMLFKALSEMAAVAAPPDFRSVLGLTDKCERRLLQSFDQRRLGLADVVGLPLLEKTYDDFIVIDAYLFTLETFAELQEKDIIDTVRISPRDAKLGFSSPDLKQKVAGDALVPLRWVFQTLLARQRHPLGAAGWSVPDRRNAVRPRSDPRGGGQRSVARGARCAHCANGRRPPPQAAIPARRSRYPKRAGRLAGAARLQQT